MLNFTWRPPYPTIVNISKKVWQYLTAQPMAATATAVSDAAPAAAQNTAAVAVASASVHVDANDQRTPYNTF